MQLQLSQGFAGTGWPRIDSFKCLMVSSGSQPGTFNLLASPEESSGFIWLLPCTKRSRLNAIQSQEVWVRTSAVSLVLHFVGQTKSKSQPRLKGYGKRFTSNRRSCA